MKFRTEYTPSPSSLQLNPEYPVITIGSCFADYMAERMRFALWDARNPFGALFNPLSIARAVRLALLLTSTSDNYRNEGIKEVDNSIFSSNPFKSWLFDSSFNAWKPEDIITKAQHASRLFTQAMSYGWHNPIIITFGTAWCYFYEPEKDYVINKPEKDYVVANCHKMPQNLFERRLVSAEEIAAVWSDVITKVRSRWPHYPFLFTISPVRHLRDGFAGNSLSKATLRLAIERICTQHDHCHYFPAYEIINDDLRDYRFYAQDLVHPSKEAVEYLWENFCATFLDATAMQTLATAEKLHRSVLHRPINVPPKDNESLYAEEKKRLDKIRTNEASFQMMHPHMLRP